MATLKAIINIIAEMLRPSCPAPSTTSIPSSAISQASPISFRALCASSRLSRFKRLSASIGASISLSHLRSSASICVNPRSPLNQALADPRLKEGYENAKGLKFNQTNFSTLSSRGKFVSKQPEFSSKRTSAVAGRKRASSLSQNWERARVRA
jgi:hypothetical protein